MERFSTYFVRTLREDPADAEVASHRLLVRGGYIRRAAAGGFTWLPLGLRVLRRVEAIVRQEMDAAGFQELLFPGPAAACAVRGERSVGRLRRQPVPARRPSRQRPPARADARGDVHAAGQGPVLLVQGPAAVDLPDPDQVPRRGASPRRAAAWSRVRDEGQLLVRPRRRGPGRVLPGAPRCLRAHLRPARGALRHRRGDVGRDGRLGVRGVPRPARRWGRTRSCAARTAATRPTSRPSRCRRRTRRRWTAHLRPGSWTRRGRRRSRRWSTNSTTATTSAAATGRGRRPTP